MRIGKRATSVACLVGVVGIAGATLARAPRASQAAHTSPDAIAALEQCRAITAADARLACFDAAAAALHQAIGRKDVVVLDQAQVRNTRRSLFGFSLPNLAPFGLAANGSGEIREVDAKLKSVRRMAYEVYDLTLDNGAIWRNTELIEFPPDIGQTVKIRRAPLGGFFLELPSGRTVRAVRVG